MKCCNKSCLKLTVKASLCVVLLVLFFKVYFINQVTDFAKGLSTVTTRYEYPETIEPPTVIICFDKPFKTSVANYYGVNGTDDIANPKTIFSYDEITYKLGRDFELVSWDWDWATSQYSNQTILHEGLNTIEPSYFVDFVQTYFNARCTKITPKFSLQDLPYSLYFKVMIKSGSLKNKEDHPTRLKLYLTSNDTWQGIFWDSWSIFKPTILEINFEETYSKKVAVLAPTKLFFKDGVDSQSKCIGNNVYLLKYWQFTVFIKFLTCL